MKPEIYCVDETRTNLGESALWSVEEQAIYWVDGLAPTIYRRKLGEAVKTTWPIPEEVGCIGLRRGGGLVAALRRGFFTLDTKTGKLDLLADPEPDRPRSRFNDGKTDRRGRFWSGTVQEALKPTQAEGNAKYYDPVGMLWRLDSDYSTHKMATGITMNNGLCWSPDDRRMYFSDSFTRKIVVYDFDIDTGNISNRQLFASIPRGRGVCDGATVDSQGYFWCANIDGGCVTRYDPNGQVAMIFDLPVSRPTSCCFGGPTLETLFITTATRRLSEEERRRQPLAGCLLAIDTGVKGLPEPEFRG